MLVDNATHFLLFFSSSLEYFGQSAENGKSCAMLKSGVLQFLYNSVAIEMPSAKLQYTSYCIYYFKTIGQGPHKVQAN